MLKSEMGGKANWEKREKRMKKEDRSGRFATGEENSIRKVKCQEDVDCKGKVIQKTVRDKEKLEKGKGKRRQTEKREILTDVTDVYTNY